MATHVKLPAKQMSDILQPYDSSYLLRWLIPLVIGAVIWFVPPPEGVEVNAWQLFAIFVATIVGIIAAPLPMGAVAMIGIMMTAATNTLPLAMRSAALAIALSGLSSSPSSSRAALSKRGLGARIAYLFMAAFGKKSLGLSYGLVASDLVLAPAIPSNTARAGGVVFPILVSIAKAYGSNADDGTQPQVRRIPDESGFSRHHYHQRHVPDGHGGQPAGRPIGRRDQGGNHLGRLGHRRFGARCPQPHSGALAHLQTISAGNHGDAEASQIAKEKLAEMGKMKTSEWIMLGTFFLLLGLWIFGPNQLGMNATTAALIGLAALLVTTVLTWGDVLNERGAWDTLVWFAALVMMATQLNNLGMIPWFSERMGVSVGGYSWVTAFLILSLVYFYSHYFFASNTAHVSAMYAPFLAVAIVVGTPPLLAALVLAFFSNLFSSMTHYGTGPAPVLFGSGYVPMADWWRLGALISVVNIVIWLGIGGLWWKLLGIW
jgi:divalent anion:Na+ symporter, DASS family